MKDFGYLTKRSNGFLSDAELDEYASQGWMLVCICRDNATVVYTFYKSACATFPEQPKEVLVDASGKVQPTSRFMFKNALMNLGVSSQVADDWIKVRKAKKAAQTETAFRIIEKQVKLGMEMFGVTADDIIRVAVDRNWQGFKCEWLDNIDWGFYGINVGHTDLPFDNKNNWE